MPKTITVDKDAWAVSSGIVSGTIGCLTLGDTLLYTVPSGRKLIVTNLIIELVSAVDVTAVADFSSGTPGVDICPANSTPVTFITNNTFYNLTIQNSPSASTTTVVQSGGSVYLTVTIAALATTYNVRAIMKGILI